MDLTIYDTLKAIFELWKKTYLSLIPFTILVVFCLNSSLLINNIFIAIFLCLPGLYLSNFILLKLANVFRLGLLKEEEFYSLAFERYANSLMLFLGLVAVFLIVVLAAYTVLGAIAGLLIALILLIVYSYLLFSYPLVVIDNLSPIEAVKKSFLLINNHIWYVTGVFLAVGLVEIIAYALLYFCVGMKATSLIYNLIFTTLNFALSVVVLASLKAKQPIKPQDVSRKI